MLKLGRVTKVKVLFLVLVFVFHFDLFKVSAAILEKDLLEGSSCIIIFCWLYRSDSIACLVPAGLFFVKYPTSFFVKCSCRCCSLC